MGRLDLLFELGRPRAWFGARKKEEPPKEPPRPDQLKKADETEEPRRASTSSIPACNYFNLITERGDDHVTEIYKDYHLYLAAKNGNLVGFKRVLNRVSAADDISFDDILSRLSPVGNTYLHVAAKHGNEDIVTFIAEKKPSLVLSKNFKGETALHLAAKAGDESMVKALVRIQQQVLPTNEVDEDENNLLRAKNEVGNTPLLEALFNGRDSIARYLIELDHELSYYQNKDGESALYLAAKAGFANCVSLILRLSNDAERVIEQFKKKSPIQAAIQGKHRGVLEAMLHRNSSFIQLRDGEGRNPLHYAASLGYLEDVRYLHGQYAHNATQKDKNGALPIHLASIAGHVDVVRFFIQDCPDPGELLDLNRCSILHVAAMSGRLNIFKFVLKTPDLEDLINMKDINGNTPLHLAAINSHPNIVSALTWDKRVDIKVVNNIGMTALDAAALRNPCSTKFAQLLTWAALKAAGTPQYLSSETRRRTNSIIMDNYKDIINTLLLVSILVATVTFAAGFTLPGGYNSSECSKDLGMATMLREKGFHVFVFCDTIAMYSSIVVAVALIWAQFHDLTLVINALTLAVPLLGIAVSMMSMAFTAGLFIVVSKLRWLSIVVLAIGITFLVILFLLILPLCTPRTSRNRILRYISYYPFCLMILASSKCLVV